MARKSVISLTTDFGHADPFVGTIKGVILRINPSARIVDLSHDVSAHDVLDGALTLWQGYRFFPRGTVHIVVVDPGVGSERRAILASTLHFHFVAPDNGVLSFIYERERGLIVRQITASRFFLKPVSLTFHGRDIFAPVAAWLSRGIQPKKFGRVITDYVKAPLAKPRRAGEGCVEGEVIRVDRFGNLLTNIGPAEASEIFSDSPPPFQVVINGHEISKLYVSFAAGVPDEPFLILGSSGWLEIAINRRSAAEFLRAGRGTPVLLRVL